MSAERIAITAENALARLDVIPDYDPGDGPQPCVHTFVQSSFGLLGAHWAVADVEAAFREWGVEESGPEATAMGHGLVVIERKPRNRAVFFATRKVAA